MKLGENIVFTTSTFTRTDGSIGTLADAALAFKPGTSTTAITSAKLRDFMLAEMLVRPNAEEQSAAGLASGIADTRLAQMIQDMASFGGRTGEADCNNRLNGLPQPIDFLAA